MSDKFLHRLGAIAIQAYMWNHENQGLGLPPIYAEQNSPASSIVN